MEIRELKGRKNKSEIMKLISSESLQGIVDIIYELLREIECAPERAKITLTERQFLEHFRISEETGQRGRPLGSKNKPKTEKFDTLFPNKDK